MTIGSMLVGSGCHESCTGADGAGGAEGRGGTGAYTLERVVGADG